MESDTPSVTAFITAAARAVHAEVDGEPLILDDPVALRLLRDQVPDFLWYQREYPTHPLMAQGRADVLCRTRRVEDVLAAAVEDGVGQYVLLAAGLDSFAHRNPLAARVRTFELDHPASQAWKTRAVEEQQIPALGDLVHLPVDLEHDDPVDRLAEGGFDLSRRAVVSWMGCTVYLTREAISATLISLARLVSGSEILFDCMAPLAEDADEAAAERAGAMNAAMTKWGEPWRSPLNHEDVDALLAEAGLRRVEYLSTRDAVPPETWERTDALSPNPRSWIVRAAVD